MRYKIEIKKKARFLRQGGASLGQIHMQTNVPKTTIRSWIKDISLSEEQRKNILNCTQKALQKGRIRSQKEKKIKREEKAEKLLQHGIKEIGCLDSRDFLIAGAALYWAEGFKNRHEHRLGFCNSDPDMIKFYIYWLEKHLKLHRSLLIVRLTLNYSYKNRAKEIQDYWVNMLKLSHSQFSKPFFQHSKWKKRYNTKEYYGVLRVHVKNSGDYLLKMKGWIEGLKMLKY